MDDGSNANNMRETGTRTRTVPIKRTVIETRILYIYINAIPTNHFKSK